MAEVFVRVLAGAVVDGIITYAQHDLPERHFTEFAGRPWALLTVIVGMLWDDLRHAYEDRGQPFPASSVQWRIGRWTADLEGEDG